MAVPARTRKGHSRILRFDLASGITTFTDAPLAGDVEWEITPEMEAVRTRQTGRLNPSESHGYTLIASGQLRVPEAEMGNALYVALRDAALAGTPIGTQLAGGTANGDELLTFWAEFTQFQKQDPVNGHTIINFALIATTAASGELPAFTTVSA